MPPSHVKRVLLPAALLSTLLLVACQGEDGEPSTDASIPAEPARQEPVAASAAGNCQAPPSWFSSFPPALPSGETAITTDCNFHQWSWQSFLALVAGDPPLFEEWSPPLDFYCAPGTSPAEKCASSMPGAQVKHLLTPHSIKEDNVLSTGEAKPIGGTRALFAYDRGPNLSGSDVNSLFSSSRVNQTWKDSVEAVTQHDLRTPEGYDAWVNDPGAQDPSFEIGSFELKPSWVLAADVADKSEFFTVQAYQSTGAGCELIEVALVGFHVVGWVKRSMPDHVAGVWATFEHRSNAPDCSQITPDYRPGHDEWTFYFAENVDCTGCVESSAGCPCNQPQGAPDSPGLEPTKICRVYPWGGGSLQNQTAIQDLNESVWSGLSADSVWRNYMLVGTLWTKDGGLPMVDPPNNATNYAGSVLLADTTLEPFIGSVQEGLQGSGCFSCHDGRNPFPDVAGPEVTRNLFMSHLIVLPALASKTCTPVSGSSGTDTGP